MGSLRGLQNYSLETCSKPSSIFCLVFITTVVVPLLAFLRFISLLVLSVFKCLYGQQGFCCFGISMMCKKVIQENKMDSDILTPQKLASNYPLQPRTMKLTVSQCKIRAWVFEWVVTLSQELPNLTRSGNCCFSSGQEFSSTKNKQTEVGETMRSSRKQNKSITRLK